MLLPVLREIGMDVYQSLTPPPFGDTGLDDALRVMEGITLMGGIDQIDFLRKATPDAVYRQAAEMLRIARAARSLHPWHKRLHQRAYADREPAGPARAAGAL